MGEYVHYKKDSHKIGTCEDLYYIRAQDFHRMLPQFTKQPGNLSPAEYLNPEHGFRFRFPFPTDDYKARTDGFLYNGAYEPGFSYHYLGGRLARETKDKEDIITHSTICLRYGGSSDDGFNVIGIPCPNSAKAREVGIHTSYRPTEHMLITQHKIMPHGELWIVVACPLCTHKVRVPAEEAALIVMDLRQQSADKMDMGLQDEAEELALVAGRISAGYHSLRDGLEEHTQDPVALAIIQFVQRNKQTALTIVS